MESVTRTDVTRELTLLCQDESKDIFVEVVSAELYLCPLFRQHLCLYGGKDEGAAWLVGLCLWGWLWGGGGGGGGSELLTIGADPDFKLTPWSE